MTADEVGRATPARRSCRWWPWWVARTSASPTLVNRIIGRREAVVQDVRA